MPRMRAVCRSRMTAYASTQAHSSIEKAMMVAGLGRENLRMIDVDGSFAHASRAT